MTRSQRRSKTETFRFEPGLDAFDYRDNGKTFDLGLFPQIFSGYPDLPKVTLQMKQGRTAPPKAQISAAVRQIREIDNVLHVCYCVQFHGSLFDVQPGDKPADTQFVAIIMRMSGEVVKTVYASQGDSLDLPEQMVNYAFHRINFDRDGAKLENKYLRTTILPVDEVKLKHDYTATAIAPFGTISHTGSVTDLRAKKINPDGNFKFFVSGHTWPTFTGGTLIALDFEGKYHVGVFENGQLKTPIEKVEALATGLFIAARHASNTGV